MIRVGIDEITVVAMLTNEYKELVSLKDWDVLAEEIIIDIEESLSLEIVFGKKCLTDSRLVAGYNSGYRYGDHPFYFSVNYHDAYHKMGIAIKFSAQALKYCQVMFATLDSYM